MKGTRLNALPSAARCLVPILLAILFIASGRAQAPSPPPATDTPAAPAAEPVTITILPTGSGLFRVTVLFPRAVERATAAAALNTLVHRSGWQAAGLEWTETPATGRFPAQTSAEFVVNSLYPNGEFPVEAIAVALRSWRAINVMFSHGGMFQYRGQPRYEDENALVEISAEPNALTLHYDIRNSNLESLPIVPALSPGAATPQPEARRGIPLVGWALIAILGAILAWVLVYALLSGATRPGRPARPARK